MRRHVFVGFAAFAMASVPFLATPALAADAGNFPAQGESMTYIVPWSAGGGSDTTGRLMASELEKELGVPVEVTNVPGGGCQLGMGEMASATADGYTVGQPSLPGCLTVYLDPERQAQFSRSDFAAVALINVDPVAVIVRDDSPYETLEDLVNAAKESPGTITVSGTGVLSDNHMAAMLLMDAADVEFRVVNFAGGTAEARPALLGGHVDVSFDILGSQGPLLDAGSVRILGILDSQRSDLFPDVPTLEEQGYPVYMASSRALVAPAGVPAEIIAKISSSVEQILQDEPFRQKMAETQNTLPRYMGPEELEAYWDQLEATVEPLIERAREE